MQGIRKNLHWGRFVHPPLIGQYVVSSKIYERVPERFDQTGVMKKKLAPIFLKFSAYSKFESLKMMG